jgi:hypothetical protein
MYERGLYIIEDLDHSVTTSTRQWTWPLDAALGRAMLLDPSEF